MGAGSRRVTVGRAVLLGTVLILVAGGVSLLPLVGSGIPEWLLAGVSVSPLLASFVASWLAPRLKVLAGGMMFVPAVLVVLGVNSTYQWLGRPVDFAGLQGARILAGVTLAWNLPACFVVALAAAWLSGRWHRRSVTEASRQP
jgi:hypothetical protein